MNEINIKIKVSDKDIDDILCAAFEGGISYWAIKARPKNDNFFGASYASDAMTKGATIIIETDDGQSLELTKDKFMDGLQKAATRCNHLFKMEGDGLDIGYIDANAADVIVQMAVFGEPIYG